MSQVSRDNGMFQYLERSLSLLNPWSKKFDSGLNITKVENNYLIAGLVGTEGEMAKVFMNRGQFDVAEGHCQRCLAYSKRSLDGEVKSDLISDALFIYCSLRERQGSYPGAVSFAEECYNTVVEAYDPVHPKVLKAAGILINLLCKKGDLYDAERYAQVTYGTLRDKKNGIDQEGEDMAMGVQNLAGVILLQNGDLIKAENLAREALRIRSQLHSNDIASVCQILGRILQAQGNLGDETKGLFERALAIAIRNFGSEGMDAAIGYFNLGLFYCCLARAQISSHSKRTEFLLAKSHIKKTLRITYKAYGPTHPKSLAAASELDIIESQLSSL
jgi:tetratricopeptide (TPR) repeat protein